MDFLTSTHRKHMTSMSLAAISTVSDAGVDYQTDGEVDLRWRAHLFDVAIRLSFAAQGL